MNALDKWKRTRERERLAGMIDTDAAERIGAEFVHVAARTGERTLDGEVIVSGGRVCARCGEALTAPSQPPWNPGDRIAVPCGAPFGGWRTYRSPSCLPMSRRRPRADAKGERA